MILSMPSTRAPTHIGMAFSQVQSLPSYLSLLFGFCIVTLTGYLYLLLSIWFLARPRARPSPQSITHARRAQMMMMMMMLTMMIHSRFGPSNVVVGAFTPRLPSSRVEGKARAPSASRRSWGSGNQMSEASVRALAAVRPLDEEIAMLDDAEEHRPLAPDPFEEDGNIRSLSPDNDCNHSRLSSSLAPRSNRAVAYPVLRSYPRTPLYVRTPILRSTFVSSYPVLRSYPS